MPITKAQSKKLASALHKIDAGMKEAVANGVSVTMLHKIVMDGIFELAERATLADHAASREAVRP